MSIGFGATAKITGKNGKPLPRAAASAADVAISYTDPADRDWAVKAFKSIAHNSNATESV